ncbi:MAG: hypothetical protein HGA22_01655 [Clostridiales bacterium]|nr:hypothetical protein [Clostridiales bacterium]
MKLKKVLIIILVICMLIPTAVTAADDLPAMPQGEGVMLAPPPGFPGGDMPDTSQGGKARAAPPDNSTKAVNLLGERSAVYFEFTNGGYKLHDNSRTADGFETANKLSVPVVGKEYTISGVNIRYDSIDYDTTNKVGNSGIVINSLKDAATPFTIGGDKDYYTVGGKGYNSVIVTQAKDDEYQDAKATESAQGVGIAYNGPQLTLDNVYMESKGAGRPNVLIPSSMRDKNVTQAGKLIVKNSLIKNESTRALLLMGGDAYFYNNSFVTGKWGCLSFDNTASVMYAVNNDILVDAVTGYGTYVAAGCKVKFYGVHAMSGDNAVRICRDGVFYSDTLQNATEESLSKLDASEKAGLLSVKDSRVAAYEGRNMLAGGFAGMTVHADMAGPKTQAKAEIKNTIISTLPEDVVYSNGTSFKDTEAQAFYYNRSVNDYFMYKLVHGADVLVTSHSADFSFDNVEMRSSTGTLVRTVYGYDAMASGIYPKDGKEYIGDEFSFSNMEAKGDIIHEDYMRKMNLSLNKTSLEGAVVSGTVTTWNNHWSDLSDPSEELKKIGVDTTGVVFDHDKVLSNLVSGEGYDTIWGVRMNLDGASEWTVTGNSSLYSLELEPGAVIKAPEGKSLEVYAGVVPDSKDSFYDWTTGTKVEYLAAGVKYSGVVILVKNAGEGITQISAMEPEAEKVTKTSLKLESIESSSDKQLASYKIGGESYIRLRDLAMLLSGTANQFNISYNEVAKVITLFTGKDYAAVGDEMSEPAEYNGSGIITGQKLVIDGKPVVIPVYNIAKNNYVRFKDLAAYLGIKAE